MYFTWFTKGMSRPRNVRWEGDCILRTGIDYGSSSREKFRNFPDIRLERLRESRRASASASAWDLNQIFPEYMPETLQLTVYFVLFVFSYYLYFQENKLLAVTIFLHKSPDLSMSRVSHTDSLIHIDFINNSLDFHTDFLDSSLDSHINFL